MLKAELKEKLGRMYEVKDPSSIFVLKFRTHFGGGKSTGFELIYDSVENANKYESRLIRNGLDTKVEKSRKQLKERKNKAKKIRGVKKTKAGDAAKKLEEVSVFKGVCCGLFGVNLSILKHVFLRIEILVAYTHIGISILSIVSLETFFSNLRKPYSPNFDLPLD
ncbi:hypothetical protein QVD17_17129 [Tagetes erecta]|uniref:40S ribosomal protein S24 n=1 Tax=Tagetes erecta TaxID=13708 RepID=A0AAD8P038_TARER|nr:hypothetical protein QVD17_17129 [Tagetes erecta]